MIAKLIAHGATRAEALDRLADALAETEVRGVTTNLPFLRWLVSHPVVRAGHATTAFLTEHPRFRRNRDAPTATPFRTPWRLNLPSPVPLTAGHRRRVTAPDRCARCELGHGADAGDGASASRSKRATRSGTTAARRARGDEDGDPGRTRRSTGTVKSRARRPMAIGWPAGRCSSSSRAQSVAILRRAAARDGDAVAPVDDPTAIAAAATAQTYGPASPKSGLTVMS